MKKQIKLKEVTITHASVMWIQRSLLLRPVLLHNKMACCWYLFSDLFVGVNQDHNAPHWVNINIYNVDEDVHWGWCSTFNFWRNILTKACYGVWNERRAKLAASIGSHCWRRRRRRRRRETVPQGLELPLGLELPGTSGKEMSKTAREKGMKQTSNTSRRAGREEA